MNNGWIKIHRKFLKWGWYQKSEMVHLFIHFLLLANHEDNEWQGVDIKRGQFVTGRKSINKETHISQRTIRTCIEKLKLTNEITTKPTNKYTIITIVNYSQYQTKEEQPTNKNIAQLTNNRPTTDQQPTTNKNDKELKNDKNIYTTEQSSGINKVLDEFYKINPTLNYGNTTQRKATQDLIGKFKLEPLIAMITWYREKMTDQYCPVATTPLAFKNKLGDIKAFADKQKVNNLITEIKI